MSKLHFLNVRRGDCTIIEHNIGHCSVIDICAGNFVYTAKSFVQQERLGSVRGNFQMCNNPTNPVSYLNDINVSNIFRFILTHPDMDHLDGFKNLIEKFELLNFWDSGLRKEKPDFGNGTYKEEDWDAYENVRDGSTTKVLKIVSGSTGKYYNQNEDGKLGGDGLYILAPDQNLIDQANESGNTNDGSYVLLYRSPGGNILIPGDAQEMTIDYLLSNHSSDISNCDVLLAPHHGRKIDNLGQFLDVVRPSISFIGCGESENLAYDYWRNRDLPFITNNQAGNIVLECNDGYIDLYIENSSFAEKLEGIDLSNTNSQGYVHIFKLESKN